MVLFNKYKRICLRVCCPPLVAGPGVGVGIITIAILVFLALIVIF